MDKEINGNWIRVLKLIIPYAIVVGTFQYCGILLAGLHLGDMRSDVSSGQSLVIGLFSLAGTFLVVWLFRKYVDKGTFGSLGLKTVLVKDIILGIVMGFLIMLCGFLILLATHNIRYLNSNFSGYDFSLNLLFFILVAFTEEIVIRGYVLTNLMGSMNKYVALMVSSGMFSIMHMGNPDYGWLAASELFFAGILLGLSYIYTRNLWFPVALHFSWNFFQGTVFGFNVSGKHVYSVISHVRANDNLWNGGAFGFEGSVLSVILQLIAIGIVFLLFSKRKAEVIN